MFVKDKKVDLIDFLIYLVLYLLNQSIFNLFLKAINLRFRLQSDLKSNKEIKLKIQLKSNSITIQIDLTAQVNLIT